MSKFILILVILLFFSSCDEEWCSTCDDGSGSISIEGDVENSDVTIKSCKYARRSGSGRTGCRDDNETNYSDNYDDDYDSDYGENNENSSNSDGAQDYGYDDDSSDNSSSNSSGYSSDRISPYNTETVVVEEEDTRNINIGELKPVNTLEVKPSLISKYLIKDAEEYYGSKRISYYNNEIYISDEYDTILKFSISNQTTSRIKVDYDCDYFTSISGSSILILGSNKIYQCTTAGKLSSSTTLTYSNKSSYYFDSYDYLSYDGSYYWIFSDCYIYFFDSFGNYVKIVDTTDQMESCASYYYERKIVEFKGNNIYLRDSRFIKKYQKNGSELKFLSFFNYETIEPSMDLFDIAIDESENIWMYFESDNDEFWLYKVKM